MGDLSRKLSFDDETVIDIIKRDFKAVLLESKIKSNITFCPEDGNLLQVAYIKLKNHLISLNVEPGVITDSKNISFFKCPMCEKYYYSMNKDLMKGHLK